MDQKNDAPKGQQKFAVVARHAAYEGQKSGTYPAASKADAFKAFLQDARRSVGTNPARIKMFEEWANGKTVADVDCHPVA